MGPRVKLDYKLSTVSEGKGKELFDARVSNLSPQESKAFEIMLMLEYSVSLIDFDVECVAAGSPTNVVYFPSEVVLVPAPVARFDGARVAIGDEGHIVTIRREQALSWLIKGEFPELWRAASYSECRTHEMALFRGAAVLGISKPSETFEELRGKYEKGQMFRWVLASYADLMQRRELPASIVSSLTNWVRDPEQLMRSRPSENEVPAVTVSKALAISAQNSPEGSETELGSRSLEYALESLDSTLLVPKVDDPEDEKKDNPTSDRMLSVLGHVSLNVSRHQQLREVVKHAGKGATEFLVAYTLVQPDMFLESAELLYQLVRLKPGANKWDQAESLKFWINWWHQNRKPKYEKLQ
jgi:hypothetical protein